MATALRIFAEAVAGSPARRVASCAADGGAGAMHEVEAAG